MNAFTCQLDYAAGRRTVCPGDTCPFWVDDHCPLARLWPDFADDHYLVEILTDLRTELGSRNPQSALRTVHPPGLV